MDPLTQALTELGPLGIFAGFLIWQHRELQKRLDTWVGDFQKRLDDMQEKAETRLIEATKRADEQEEKLRDRYDQVIREKDLALERKTENVEKGLADIQRSVREILALQGGKTIADRSPPIR
jgi:DNA anti-recombination protein RmuC|tara:strand:+ start:3188 stop:3553 length:366 start_codon:yes stop_codon:yes gene_type:complete